MNTLEVDIIAYTGLSQEPTLFNWSYLVLVIRFLIYTRLYNISPKQFLSSQQASLRLGQIRHFFHIFNLQSILFS